MTPSRLQSLEAGEFFMIWIFSEGESCESEVRTFASALSIAWSDFPPLLTARKTVEMARLFEQAALRISSHVSPWFEVGSNTVFISNMAATGAPPDLIEGVLGGYRRYLEAAGIRIDKRDRLETLMRQLAVGSIDEKAKTLGKIREISRDLAIHQDQSQGGNGDRVNIYGGVVTFGNVIGNITAATSSIARSSPSGAKFSSAVSGLVAAIEQSSDLDSLKKKEALENIETISKEAKLGSAERTVGNFKAAISYLPTILSSVESGTKLWDTFGPSIKSYFGV